MDSQPQPQHDSDSDSDSDGDIDIDRVQHANQARHEQEKQAAETAEEAGPIEESVIGIS